LRAYFLDRIDQGIPTPGAKEAAFLRGTGQAGGIGSEARMFFGQFKSFPLVAARLAKREILGREGYLPSVGGLAHLILATTAMGYVALSLKDLIKGRKPRDITEKPGSILLASAIQGGGLGLYGDFIFGTETRYGQGPLESMLGPTWSKLSQMASIGLTMKQGKDPSMKMVNFAKQNIPFNLYYTKAALDYMIFYNIAEALKPGYKRRMERAIEKNNAQTFIIPPSSTFR